MGSLRESVSIYLAIDDRTLTVWGEPIPGVLEAERRLLGKVDQVVCVSEPLAETLRARLPQGREVPIQVLPNGYDERLFDPERKWAEPACLAGVPRPRVLVAGHISERIDWEGIAAAAQARPEYTWVFIGPPDPGMPEKIGLLAARINRGPYAWQGPGLVWRESVPGGQVPALIAHSDLCAVPYRLNAFTRASSPVKGMEYLAMGAPVLNTRIPSLAGYGEAVEWVEQGEGGSYTRALDALAAKGRAPAIVRIRREAVKDDSWAARRDKFKELVLNGAPSLEPCAA